MKTNPAPKSHQVERSEAQPQSPLAETPPEEISEARLNQLAKDYGPSIERAIAIFYGKPAKRPYHSKAFQNRMREKG